MQPLRIRLGGEYWDSFLYNNNLMLLTCEGTLEFYDWDQLLEELVLPDRTLRTPLRHLAGRGRAWYGLAARELIRDSSAGPALRDAAEALALTSLSIPRETLRRKRRHAVDVELFPTTDLEVFANELFVGSSEGVASDSLHRPAGMNLTRQTLISDAPALSLAASYSHLAIAHGSDGLSEVPIGGLSGYRGADGGPKSRDELISAAPCYSCGWASFDLVAACPGSGGYLGAFSKPPGHQSDYEERSLLGTIDSSELFGADDGLLVGAGKVLLLLREKEMRDEHWNPFNRRELLGVDLERSRVEAEPAATRTREPEPIDAAVTVFGVVLELDNRLVVHGSDGVRRTFEGEPVAWRVFTRSQRYLNHLHIVRYRSVDIHAFVHDYFVAEATRSIAMARPRGGGW